MKNSKYIKNDKAGHHEGIEKLFHFAFDFLEEEVDRKVTAT